MACLVLGLGYAILLYYKQSRLKDLSIGLVYTLFGLRTIVIATIAFLLLGPFFRFFERQIQRPVVIFAQDNSASILQTADSTFYKEQFQAALSALRIELSEDYDVESYVFDKELMAQEIPDFNGKQTDISSALKALYERNMNRNVGAMILSSDGIYNRGSSPVHQVGAMGIPVFTIALGDTARKKDLILDDVAHNRLAYLGNDFPMEAAIKAYGLKGQSSTLIVRRGTETLVTKRIDIKETDFLINIPLQFKAGAVGRQYYDVSLSAISGELTTVNNHMRIFVDVLDSRQKILILFQSPHPDIAALREALETNENYEVMVGDEDAFYDNSEDVDLLIMHGGPGRKGNGNGVIDKAKKAKIPLWLIQTLGTDVQAMSKADLGVDFTARGVSSTSDASARPTSGFSFFQWSDDAKTLISELPPLQSYFGQAETENGAQVALKQRIGVVDTDQPLWAFKEVNGFKSSVLVGEGLWRWRMADFMSKGNHDRFNELIAKAVQYMAAKEDKRFFRVYSKTTFDEDEDILLDAELYDASYELVNEPEVSMKLKDQDENEFDLAFNRYGSSYRLNAGRLPAGTYSYTANIEYGGSKMQGTGSFDIQAIQLEERRTTADHQLLYKLASSTGGKMYDPHDLTAIQDDLRSEKDLVPIIYSTEQVKELIDTKWLFFLILILLGSEWFIRKYRGAY